MDGKCKYRFLLHTTLIVAICFASVALRAASPQLISFTLEDHSKAKYSPGKWIGKGLVLFLADRKGSEYDEDYVWTSPITTFVKADSTRGEVVVASIADMRGTPKLARGIVRGMFEPKDRDPVGLTLLDWDGSFFKAYGLEPTAFHVLVFNHEHRLVHKVSLHEFDANQLHSIESVLKELTPLVGAPGQQAVLPTPKNAAGRN
jgi:hypothetical protein